MKFASVFFVSGIFFLLSVSSVRADLCPPYPEKANCVPAEQAARYTTSQASTYSCFDGGQYYTCFRDLFSRPVTECPQSGASCVLYQNIPAPGPLYRNYTHCTAQGLDWACCPQGTVESSHVCVDAQTLVSLAETCCQVGQTTCTLPGGASGYCSGQGRLALACGVSEKRCVPMPQDTDPGQFTCACTLGQGVWNCRPSMSGLNPRSCGALGTPDLGACRQYNAGSGGDWNSRPRNFCTRVDGGRCEGNLPCISVLSQNNVQHGQPCDAAADHCEVSQGLSCQNFNGQYFCAYAPGTRGGPSQSAAMSTCLWSSECIQRIGVEDGPENHYICEVSEGVPCVNGVDSSCTCRPPQGTWCGPDRVPCSSSSPQPQSQAPFELCAQARQQVSRNACQTCLTAGGIWTAIGCLSTDPVALIASLVRFALGVAGGSALLMILYGAMEVTVAGSDLQKVEDARSVITSAVMGLLFILFSVSILQFIGVTILQIPGFG